MTGLKANGSLKISRATTINRQDRQPQPAGLTAGLTQGPARFRRLMGLQQVVHLAFGEGRIAGAHQLFGGFRPPLLPVQRSATTAVLAAATGAGS